MQNYLGPFYFGKLKPVSYTHLRAHETVLDLVCRLTHSAVTPIAYLQHTHSQHQQNMRLKN